MDFNSLKIRADYGPASECVDVGRAIESQRNPFIRPVYRVRSSSLQYIGQPSDSVVPNHSACGGGAGDRADSRSGT